MPFGIGAEAGWHMARLTGHEVEQLQGCVREIYAHLDVRTFADHVVAITARCIPSSFVSWATISQRGGRLAYRATASRRQMEYVDAFIRNLHEHPLLSFLHPGLLRPHPFREDIARAMHACHPAFRQHPYGTAVRISDALPDRQFRRLAVFNDFFRRNEAAYQMAIGVLPGSDGYTTLTVNRKKRDFSEQERLALNLLGPHIEQAHQNAVVHDEARRAYAALERSNRSIQSYGLTYREEDVLYWVAQGKTNREVAKILEIASGTVKIHLERIYQKLGVENRTAAAALALGTEAEVKSLNGAGISRRKRLRRGR